MIIPHKALVLIADGKKFLLLRNTGDLRQPVLAYEGGGDIENPATAQQGTDQPGRAFASTGSARSAMEQTDFHQIEEDHFAGQVADILGKLAEAGDFNELIVVAPPKSLAELRERFDRSVTSRLLAEIPKDLTKHTVSEITEILQRESKE